LINAMRTIIEALIYGYFHYCLSEGFIAIAFQNHITTFSIAATFFLVFSPYLI